jgi:two-component system, chemotaxis family, chemotaxis protein CheY
MARESGQPYNLVCMDIRMPEMDGQAALRAIRAFEESKRMPLASRVKIIMTTALDSSNDVMAAVDGSCDAYLLKPIDIGRLLSHLKSFHLA